MNRALSLLAGAAAVSLVATVMSLVLSGVPALGWWGMGLFPCELCWYQRILMYPLPLVLGVGLWRANPEIAWPGLALALPGVLIALYHSLIQLFPTLQLAQCGVGSCTAKLWTLAGLTIPNLSLLAFLIVSGLLAAAAKSARDAPGA